MTLTLKSHPKINLFFHINDLCSNPEYENYYNIESGIIFCKDVYDTIIISADKKFKCTFSIQIPQDNTITKAVRLMSSAASKSPDFKIHVYKNIPTGSGLGGGSANAGTIIRWLAEKWSIKKNTSEKIAHQVGADVKICYKNSSSLVCGIGDKIYPLKVNLGPDASLLLVNPGIHIDTGTVYKKYHLDENKKPTKPIKKTAHMNIRQIQQYKNDLYTNASEIEPKISQLIELISKQSGCVISRMSGSGSTCFGIFKKKEKAVLAAQKILNQFPEFWVKVCKDLY